MMVFDIGQRYWCHLVIQLVIPSVHFQRCNGLDLKFLSRPKVPIITLKGQERIKVCSEFSQVLRVNSSKTVNLKTAALSYTHRPGKLTKSLDWVELVKLDVYICMLLFFLAWSEQRRPDPSDHLLLQQEPLALRRLRRRHRPPPGPSHHLLLLRFVRSRLQKVGPQENRRGPGGWQGGRGCGR